MGCWLNSAGTWRYLAGLGGLVAWWSNDGITLGVITVKGMRESLRPFIKQISINQI